MQNNTLTRLMYLPDHLRSPRKTIRKRVIPLVLEAIILSSWDVPSRIYLDGLHPQSVCQDGVFPDLLLVYVVCMCIPRMPHGIHCPFTDLSGNKRALFVDSFTIRFQGVVPLLPGVCIKVQGIAVLPCTVARQWWLPPEKHPDITVGNTGCFSAIGSVIGGSFYHRIRLLVD
jgi:hypothetical protein